MFLYMTGNKNLAVLQEKLSRFSNCLFCRLLPGLPRYLGPLGGSRNGLGLATMKMRFSPAHDLRSMLSNRSHGVPDLAGESPLRSLGNQSTGALVQGLRGSGLPGPRL
jgi:hypothetical protein